MALHVRIPMDTQHSTSAQVAARLAAGEPLTAGDAAAIAAGWQAPGGYGRTFAALCSPYHGAPLEDLLSAIGHEASTTADPEARAELDALTVWAGLNATEDGQTSKLTRVRCSHVGLRHSQHWADECPGVPAVRTVRELRSALFDLEDQDAPVTLEQVRAIPEP